MFPSTLLERTDAEACETGNASGKSSCCSYPGYRCGRACGEAMRSAQELCHLLVEGSANGYTSGRGVARGSETRTASGGVRLWTCGMESESGNSSSAVA